MNAIWLQSLDTELLHFALAALAAVFACVCSVIGVALGFMVKRAIAKWFDRQDASEKRADDHEKRIAALESAPGFRAITDGRTEIVLGRGPTDGGLGNS